MSGVSEGALEEELQRLLREAERRLSQAEAHAIQLAEVIAGGGTALPEPADGRIELGTGCLFVTMEDGDFLYRFDEGGADGYSALLDRPAALAVIVGRLVAGRGYRHGREQVVPRRHLLGGCALPDSVSE